MFDPIEPDERYGLKRLLTLLLSVLVHALVVILLIIVPLIYFNILPQPEVLAFLAAPPPPPPPRPPTPPPGKALSVPHQEVEAKYLAPASIPKGIPPPNLEPPAVTDSVLASIDSSVPGGVIGGVPGGVPGGIVGGVLGRTAPPRALPPPPPPPPKPKVRRPIRVGGDLQAAKLIFKVDPSYPVLAKEARISGAVVLEITVDESGDVSNVKVLSGHPLLVRAAADAVRQWKYAPTVLNGVPVPVIATVTVNFTLQGPSA